MVPACKKHVQITGPPRSSKGRQRVAAAAQKRVSSSRDNPEVIRRLWRRRLGVGMALPLCPTQVLGAQAAAAAGHPT